MDSRTNKLKTLKSVFYLLCEMCRVIARQFIHTCFMNPGNAIFLLLSFCFVFRFFFPLFSGFFVFFVLI